MKRLLTIAGLAWLVPAMPGVAAPYGTVAGCQDPDIGASREPNLFFNGMLFGNGWSCSQSNGLCVGEAGNYNQVFAVEQTARQVVITFDDGRQYTLPICSDTGSGTRPTDPGITP